MGGEAMNLSEDQKRLLTEFLGECWHEFSKDVEGFDGPCVKCRTWRSSSIVRTFLTYQDLGDVKEKLVEKGLWSSFLIYAICKFQDERGLGAGGYTKDIPGLFIWFLCPLDEQGNPHFCRLVAEFLEGQK
jgi:hypothetical protein